MTLLHYLPVGMPGASGLPSKAVGYLLSTGQINGLKLIEPLVVNGIEASSVTTAIVAILEPTALNLKEAFANRFLDVVAYPHVDGVNGPILGP